MGVGNKNGGGMAIILRFALLDHIFPPVEWFNINIFILLTDQNPGLSSSGYIQPLDV